MCHCITALCDVTEGTDTLPRLVTILLTSLLPQQAGPPCLCPLSIKQLSINVAFSRKLKQKYFLLSAVNGRLNMLFGEIQAIN